MKHRFILSPSLLGWLSAAGISGTLVNVGAQAPPPPLPPPVGEEATPPPEAPAPQTEAGGSSNAAEGAPPQGEPASAPPPKTEAAPSAEAAPNAEPPPEPWEQPVEEAVVAGPPPPPAAAIPVVPAVAEEHEDPATWFRKTSLRRQSSLSGSTGLQRVKEAGSGAPGTFRFGITGGFYSGKGFLCRDNAECRNPITGDVLEEDKARRSDANITLSATPFSFLEIFFGIKNSATSNSNGTPDLLTVVGDANIGIKGFTPDKPDQIFTYGGEVDLYLMTGTGGVGLAGSATSVGIRGLASMNLNNRTLEEERIPLRAHANFGYFVDNSGNIVKSLEETAPPLGRGSPIERTERYGLGISRVDAIEVGLGTEYIHPYVRPFLEWTLDIPVNRQKYVCNPTGAASRGDECLGGRDAEGKKVAGLGTSPNRITLGARVFPWQPTGLAITAALDIATGGSKRFLEETTPETPYSLWLGVAYAVDTAPPPVTQAPLAALPTMEPETRRYIVGRILETSQNAPVPNAIIRYDGVPMTGLVADATGQFITQDLPPGEYSFKIFADQFREGLCTTTIPETAPLAPVAPEASAAEATDAQASSENAALDANAEGANAEGEAQATIPPAPEAPYMDPDGNVLVPLDCQLEELPRVANIVGLLVDSVSGGPVPDASVTITDNLNRSLKLAVDAVGSFQFRNVPFGAAHITASAPGYLTTVTPISVDKREGLAPHLLMNARPDKLALKVGPKQITLDRAILFVGDQAQVTINSMSIIEEVAEAMKEDEKIASVEIQVHTDDSGAASYSRQLSQERADGIKDILVRLGVAKERLTAKGYGPDQPLAPNVSEANRAANNRVQLMRQKSVAEF